MTWFAWTLVAWLAVGVAATIAVIGKPRKPVDPTTAVVTLIINGFLIAGVFAGWL